MSNTLTVRQTFFYRLTRITLVTTEISLDLKILNGKYVEDERAWTIYVISLRNSRGLNGKLFVSFSCISLKTFPTKALEVRLGQITGASEN